MCLITYCLYVLSMMIRGVDFAVVHTTRVNFIMKGYKGTFYPKLNKYKIQVDQTVYIANDGKYYILGKHELTYGSLKNGYYYTYLFGDDPRYDAYYSVGYTDNSNFSVWIRLDGNNIVLSQSGENKSITFRRGYDYTENSVYLNSSYHITIEQGSYTTNFRLIKGYEPIATFSVLNNDDSTTDIKHKIIHHSNYTPNRNLHLLRYYKHRYF